MIEHFGIPYTIIPKEPPYLKAAENLEYFKTFGLENCLEYAWHKEGTNHYVTLFNLLDYSSCYPNKKNVVWITYSLLKE